LLLFLYGIAGMLDVSGLQACLGFMLWSNKKAGEEWIKEMG